MTLVLESFSADRWIAGQGRAAIRSAITGDVVAEAGSDGLDFAAMVLHARAVGGPALRAMPFPARAAMLRALAEAVAARKEELYALSNDTGATRADGWVDIEGGAGTLFAYASKARRELPDDTILPDGASEPLGRRGTFLGQHVWTSRRGVAVHINAFNFPVWGMLEKLAPALLAGVPAIVKPATATAQVAAHAFRILVETGALPPGAVQLVTGSVGDLLDHLGCQDVVSFTGSADTAMRLQRHPVMARESVTFIAERDSLNAALLAPGAEPPEVDLFVAEVAREMTIKAGQRCTAIRRAFVPRPLIDRVQDALRAALDAVVVGDPRAEGVTMGALVSQAQRSDVREKIAALSAVGRIVFGDPSHVDARGADSRLGAFMSPVLLRADDPWAADAVHDTEPFGPVATLLPYGGLDEGIALVNRGQGSLVLSVYTHDPAQARALVSGAAAFHGRMLILDRDCAGESTGHGSPLPSLVHGGPGRAGGGEELGGMRGMTHYMQRTALQGSPRMLAGVLGTHVTGAPTTTGATHPFRLRFGELAIGQSLTAGPRVITLEDIEHFAHFTGDTFYAHMDEAAAAANPFFPGRVAHGYLLLSFAAGLFVDPAPGPVLANYGLDELRFLKPVSPGDSLSVRLTAKSKTLRRPDYGEVRWAVLLSNQNGETVASYDLLTMNAV